MGYERLRLALSLGAGTARALAVVLVAVGAQALTGCASQSIGESLPTAMGGLPDSVPKRSAEPAAYPAVHDMPPTRAAAPMTEDEKKRLREELAAERERAAKQGGVSTTGTVRNP